MKHLIVAHSEFVVKKAPLVFMKKTKIFPKVLVLGDKMHYYMGTQIHLQKGR